jgi:hypothetical protein
VSHQFIDYDAHTEFFYRLVYRLDNGQATRPLQRLGEQSYGSIWAERMMTENRPPAGISLGAGSRKPKFPWKTPVQALRRPSGKIPELTYQNARAGGNLNTRGLERVDFLRNEDEMPKGWHVSRGSTSRPVGRPMVDNPSKATLRKRRQRNRDKLSKGKETGVIDTPTIAERISKLEREYTRQRGEIDEVARQVGLRFDQEAVQEAVDEFLKEALD